MRSDSGGQESLSALLAQSMAQMQQSRFEPVDRVSRTLTHPQTSGDGNLAQEGGNDGQWHRETRNGKVLYGYTPYGYSLALVYLAQIL